jgi:hypothetical protein
MNSDFKDLLRVFNEHKVRYLVVGGYAVIKYTEPRYTKDLDVWVEATPKNARAVFDALRAFGAPLTNIAAMDFAQDGRIYQMGRPPARVDVLTSIEGVRFDVAWPRREQSDFGGIPASVISREDLLVNKRAVGRLQDLVDVQGLLEAERTLKKRTPKKREGESKKPKKGRSKAKDRGTER